MYLCVSTHTGTQRNDETNKLEPVYSHDAHVEMNVDQQLELMAAGDDRVANLRIFNMGITDAGVPKIGTEVKP